MMMCLGLLFRQHSYILPLSLAMFSTADAFLVTSDLLCMTLAWFTNTAWILSMTWLTTRSWPFVLWLDLDHTLLLFGVFFIYFCYWWILAFYLHFCFSLVFLFSKTYRKQIAANMVDHVARHHPKWGYQHSSYKYSVGINNFKAKYMNMYQRFRKRGCLRKSQAKAANRYK